MAMHVPWVKQRVRKTSVPPAPSEAVLTNQLPAGLLVMPVRLKVSPLESVKVPLVPVPSAPCRL